jgi:RNA polymerase sigma factor (sigma-70 family)
MRNAGARETQRPAREHHLVNPDAQGIESTVIDRLPILDLLGRLDPRDREILELVAWEQLNTHELAIALDISEATARVRLYRARRRFESLVHDDQFSSQPQSLFNTHA